MAANSSSYGSNALKSGGPSISMVDNMGSIGIGNYKGVMLCNRPFGGTVANKVPAAGSGGKSTFHCGVVSEGAGLNVPISAKEKMIKRPNKDSVLSKHKKYLADIQKQKDRLEVEYLEEMKRKEEAQQKFQDHEKQMRLATKTMLQGNREAKDAKDAADSKDVPEVNSDYGGSAEDSMAESKHDGIIAANKTAGAKGAGSKQGGAQHKPAWAMTEKAADVQDDELRMDEENELLDFAHSLDFDKYIGDMEVQVVMERLRKRIADLEREVATEDLRNADADTRAAMRAKLEQMGIAEGSLMSEGAGGQVSAESAAMSAARALLQEEEDMQAVHSAKSVAALLKTAKDKIAQVNAAVHPGPAPSLQPKINNEPIIIVHDANEGSRLEVKNALSKLPYMNRNPAV